MLKRILDFFIPGRTYDVRMSQKFGKIGRSDPGLFSGCAKTF